MKVTLTGQFLLVERTEMDKPVVPEPYPRSRRITSSIYNSWRNDYRISFETETKAKAAEAKVNALGDFDKACAWLDKQ